MVTTNTGGMMKGCRLGILVLLFTATVFAETRTWTSLDGKTAVAEFQALEGNTLELLKGGKTIRVPFDAFSEDDRKYVRERLAEQKAELERLEQERRERLEMLLGFRSAVPIHERRWPDWESYYQESSCGTKVLRFFKNEASIVDVRDRGVFVTPEHAVRPPDYNPTMFCYCPADYDGREKLGVYIHIGAGPKGCRPNPAISR